MIFETSLPMTSPCLRGRRFARHEVAVTIVGVAAVAFALLRGTPAGASGSASVRVVTAELALEIRQTFRKSVPAGATHDYFEGVQKTFLGKARAVLPRLRAVLRRQRRTIGALRGTRSTLALSRCERRSPCPPSIARFPALLELPWLSRRRGDRTAYVVTVALRRAPSKAQITRLLRALQRAIDRGPESSDKGTLDKVGPVKSRHGGVVVRLLARYYTPTVAREIAVLRARAALVGSRLAAALPTLASGNGCRLAPFAPSLPYYEKGKRKMPAQVGVRFGNEDLVEGRVAIGLAKIESHAKVRSFTSAVEDAANKLLEGAP